MPRSFTFSLPASAPVLLPQLGLDRRFRPRRVYFKDVHQLMTAVSGGFGPAFRRHQIDRLRDLPNLAVDADGNLVDLERPRSSRDGEG